MSAEKWCYLSANQLTLLDVVSNILFEAYGHYPYLVGSVLQRPDFRDVDVRQILPDDEYDRLFPGGGTHRTDPRWSILCLALSEYLTDLIGHEVDFQFHSYSYSNQTFSGETRHPLGLYIRSESPDSSES